MAGHRWNTIIENAETLVREAAAAKASLESASGSDPSGAAGVVLGGDGRVESVKIAVDWRTLLPTGALENALREAIAAASSSRLEAWAQAMEDPEAVTAPGRSSDSHRGGGGEFQDVSFERRWLRQAHAIDIERQTLAALHDAYRKLDRDGVAQLIAASSLGEAQRAVQDPFGLARRMRLTQ